MKIEVRDLFNENICKIESPNTYGDIKLYNKLKQIGDECGYYIMWDEDDNIIFEQIWEESKVINGRVNLLNLLNYINSNIF